MADQGNSWFSLDALINALRGTPPPPPDYGNQAKRMLGLEGAQTAPPPQPQADYASPDRRMAGPFPTPYSNLTPDALKAWAANRQPAPPSAPVMPIPHGPKIADRVPLSSFEDRFDVKQDPVLYPDRWREPRQQPLTFDQRFTPMPQGQERWNLTDNFPAVMPGARMGWAAPDVPLPRARPDLPVRQAHHNRRGR